MISVLKQLLILYFFIFMGWAFGKRKPELSDKSNLLSFLLINLFLPSKLFGNFSKNFTVSYLKENYITFFISLSILLVLVALAKFLAPLLTKDSYEQKVYRYSIPIANYAYMGYVLVEALFGPQGLTNLILFCIPFICYTYSFGFALLTAKGDLWKRLLNPVTGAILVGMVFGLFQIPVPQVANTVLSMASGCVGPVSMLLAGLALSAFSLKDMLFDKMTYVFLSLRLLGIPLFVFGLCKVLGLLFTLPAAVYPSAVFMACMPNGLNTVAFPKLVGEDCRLGARLALLSHLFACITLPIWISILS